MRFAQNPSATDSKAAHGRYETREEVGAVENLFDGDAYVGKRKLEIGSPIYLGDRVEIKNHKDKKGFLLLRFKKSTLQMQGDGALKIEKEILRADQDIWKFATDTLSVIFRAFSPPPQDTTNTITGTIGVRG